ncbi:uncharacterized protein AC631_02040 [Debaryomyces fabryi]|uniref:Ribosomal RNA-processing protein 43 n=1 Tax=Debaryomyces fabryi TaxID=58627 RepID=A0A0V1Q133_9ASCO|nr:uncharacterized protein AC631_02040 [Debaryomyces fabryi]KSA02222.1 hypothetical protein AC631_02040 [Debaryomyces fabryi]CUM46588.1 unnamed protein product [Debaryomyces fabryi]
MTNEFHQISFPPSVLDRLAPDISLQRHLNLGLRPCLRNFNEFKPLDVSTGNLQELEGNSTVGSSIVKNGNTTVICGITLGVIETPKSSIFESTDSEASYTSVYPVVEISRGRSGAPTDEEMILSQKLYETILHSKIITTKSLEANPGMAIANDDGNLEIIYPGSEETSEIFNNIKCYSFVLYAHLKVFSRSGPLFDVCHTSLINALKNTKLPKVYVQDSFNNIKVPIRSRGNFGHLSKSNDVLIDGNESLMYDLPLNHDQIGFASSFGIIELESNSTNNMDVDSKSVILADLEGDSEESECLSKANIIINKDNSHMKHVSIIGGGANVNIETIKKCIQIAKLRSMNV